MSEHRIGGGDRFETGLIISSACQINCHAPVPIDSIMDMVDIPDLCHNLRFLGKIIRLPVFPVVVIGSRIYVQPAQQPAIPNSSRYWSMKR